MKHFKSHQYQSGWTFWSLLFVMLVIVFFAYIAMRLIPVYAANENVKNAMRVSLEDADLRRITRAEIVRKLNSQLYLDGTHELLDYKTDLKVQRSQREIILRTAYRNEIDLFLNLSLVASFDNEERKVMDGAR